MRKGLFMRMGGAVVAVMLCIVGCSKQERELCQNYSDNAQEFMVDAHGRTVYTCVMEFDGVLNGFDDASKGGMSTRAAGAWSEGDVVYLVFNSGSEKIEGKAVYSESAGKWVLYYYGQLAATESSTCTAYYFDGSVTMSSDESTLTIPSTTAIYGATTASYSKSGRNVTLTAELAPLTSRISFTGDNGYNFILSGFDRYNSYSLINGTISSSSLVENITIGESGETSFYYGFFPTDSPRKLTVTTSEYEFTTTCEYDVLSIANGGTMSAPTKDMHNGWTRVINERGSMYKTVERIQVGELVSFNMIRVEAGSYWMGVDDYHNYGQHYVTLSQDYYIGETEVTQQLWEAVMGYNPSSFYEINYPVENVSWDDCQNFISNLNALTGLSFRLPTEAEWEYAARGGNRSNGYTWSGSSNIDDVAWHIGNSCAYSPKGYYDYTSHQVATKSPNELGLYDMSGNVWEWCNDWYSDGFDGSYVTDPTGRDSGSERVIRGGCWADDAGGCSVACRSSRLPYDGSANRYGLRLCCSSSSFF